MITPISHWVVNAEMKVSMFTRNAIFMIAVFNITATGPRSEGVLAGLTGADPGGQGNPG